MRFLPRVPQFLKEATFYVSVGICAFFMLIACLIIATHSQQERVIDATTYTADLEYEAALYAARMEAETRRNEGSLRADITNAWLRSAQELQFLLEAHLDNCDPEPLKRLKR